MGLKMRNYDVISGKQKRDERKEEGKVGMPKPSLDM